VVSEATSALEYRSYVITARRRWRRKKEKNDLNRKHGERTASTVRKIQT